MLPRWEKQSDLWAQVAFYMGLGFIMPTAAIGGYVLGWLLDRWLHTAPVLAIVMSFVGLAGGITETVWILKQREKNAAGNNSGTGPRPS